MKKKGFTLIELMIVVAIIAILAAAALPAFGEQIKKSRDGKAVQMMGTIRSQLSMLNADLEGYWPTTAALPAALKEVETAATVESTATGVTAESFGIQGFANISTVADGGGTMNCGTFNSTGTTVAWTYASTNGKTKFADGKDTKDKDWQNY